MTLLGAAVDRELGAILRDGRMGRELIETLEVYFESGQNMRETGRRLHLAPRTVAYRLERVARLIGHPLDGPTSRRLTSRSSPTGWVARRTDPRCRNAAIWAGSIWPECGLGRRPRRFR